MEGGLAIFLVFYSLLLILLFHWYPCSIYLGALPGFFFFNLFFFLPFVLLSVFFCFVLDYFVASFFLAVYSFLSFFLHIFPFLSFLQRVLMFWLPWVYVYLATVALYLVDQPNSRLIDQLLVFRC